MTAPQPLLSDELEYFNNSLLGSVLSAWSCGDVDFVMTQPDSACKEEIEMVQKLIAIAEAYGKIHASNTDRIELIINDDFEDGCPKCGDYR